MSGSEDSSEFEDAVDSVFKRDEDSSDYRYSKDPYTAWLHMLHTNMPSSDSNDDKDTSNSDSSDSTTDSDSDDSTSDSDSDDSTSDSDSDPEKLIPLFVKNL